MNLAQIKQHRLARTLIPYLEKCIHCILCLIHYILGFIKNKPTQQEIELKLMTQLDLSLVLSLNLPVIFLIGQSNVRKSLITKKLARISQSLNTKTILKDQNFELVNFDNKFILIDTPPFDLDGDIDEREKTITLFQNIFYTLSEQIIAFIIVAKFERTDIIKQNIMKSYKFLSKFSEIIYIMISDFQLSEDQENDKIQLEDKLKDFQNQNKLIKNLLYYENSSNPHQCLIDIKKKLFKIAEKTELKQLDFSDSIFERINDEQSEQRQQELIQLLKTKKYE